MSTLEEAAAKLRQAKADCAAEQAELARLRNEVRLSVDRLNEAETAVSRAETALRKAALGATDEA